MLVWFLPVYTASHELAPGYSNRSADHAVPGCCRGKLHIPCSGACCFFGLSLYSWSCGGRPGWTIVAAAGSGRRADLCGCGYYHRDPALPDAGDRLTAAAAAMGLDGCAGRDSDCVVRSYGGLYPTAGSAPQPCPDAPGRPTRQYVCRPAGDLVGAVPDILVLDRAARMPPGFQRNRVVVQEAFPRDSVGEKGAGTFSPPFLSGGKDVLLFRK